MDGDTWHAGEEPRLKLSEGRNDESNLVIPSSRFWREESKPFLAGNALAAKA